MGINKFLEKVSWKLHRVSFKVSLFTIGYYGDSSAFNFRFFTVLNKLNESSLLSFSFRLPNKTYVNVKYKITDAEIQKLSPEI